MTDNAMRDAAALPRIPHRAKRPWLSLLIELALGALAALGMAPFEVWGATLAAFAVLVWRLSRAPSFRTVLLRAMAAGLGWFALSLHWIVEPFLIEPEIYGWMAPFALVLMALGGALFWALPIAFTYWLAESWRWRIVAICSGLILSDWARGWIFTGFPWASIGHIWIGTPIGQAASIAGAPVLSALTLIISALPALFWRPSTKVVFGFVPGAVLSVIMLGALWAGGVARLDRAGPVPTDVHLRLVQPDAQQRLKWDPEWARVYYQRLLALSAEPGRRDLVIWPESAVNFLLEDAGPVLPEMAAAAGAPLMLGIQRIEGRQFYNSLAVLDRSGQIAGLYDKFHLVPFGEYIPWGNILARFGIGAFAAQQGFGYSAGHGPTVLSLPGLPDVQPLICYEAIFPQHLRGLATRPSWLLQITNDGWFGQFSGPYQHLAQARLRAIQSGLPMVRVANTGVSAVIDAKGNILERLDLGQAGHIDAMLPGALAPTWWIIWGDWPVIGTSGLLLVGAGLWRVRRAMTRQSRR